MTWIRTGSLLGLAALLCSWSSVALGAGRPSTAGATIDVSAFSNTFVRRADPSLAGYLGVFFLGADPYVYFYLSNGNDPLSFRPLNQGSPVLRPTMGTGGVRDPTIIPGGGDEAGKKWYIIGTDLDIGKVGWFSDRCVGEACRLPPVT